MFCLIRPPGVETFRLGTLTLTPPLGAAYVAGALLAAGRQVSVIDAVAEAPRTHTAYFRGYLVGLPLEEIARRIPREAQAVGITCVFTHEWPMVVRLVELIKRSRPALPVIVGGEHVTSMPEFSLLTSRADVMVLGEGEETVVELLAALEGGSSLDGVAGIAHRDGRGIRVNPRRSRRADVDAIPLPAWDLFDLQTYHENRFVGGMYSSRLTVPILATRGCPYQCTYCSAPNMWTPRWIARDPARVADEIEGYVRRLGAGNFPFQDLTAIIRKEWIVSFCREIISRGLDITWQLPSGTRSEAIDDEVAHLLARSGMISMAYAPESGSETTRRLIKKRMTTDRLLDSVRAAAGADLNVIAYVVLGFPHDEPQHMRETLPFVRELARRGVSDLGTGYYMALPGTELFRSLYQAGRIRIDRAWFRHILEGLAVYPAASYCDAMGRFRLFCWRFRLVLAFYRARIRAAGGLAALARSTAGSMGAADHATKLQTAFRVALKNAASALRARLGPRWLSRREERALFADWDAIHRALWRESAAAPDAPPVTTDTRALHHGNVIDAIRREHATARSVRLALQPTARS